MYKPLDIELPREIYYYNTL